MSGCSCIAGVFQFYVKAIDLKTLIFKDASTWVDDTNYLPPSTYTLKVTPPASSKSKSFEISVANNNVLTWDNAELKQGIYCFQVLNCGVNYTRSIGIFPKINCCIKQAWSTLGIEYKSRIEEVESYLKMASTNAELNNVKTATQNLNKAEKLLENLKCDCSC